MKKVVTLPQDQKGRVTLIGMAYSKKSEDDLNSWFEPVYSRFLQSKSKSAGLFSAFTYDVDVYFIPMFTGVNAAASGTAKRKAAKNMDAQLLPYILFYKGSLKPYKDALDFEKLGYPPTCLCWINKAISFMPPQERIPMLKWKLWKMRLRKRNRIFVCCRLPV